MDVENGYRPRTKTNFKSYVANVTHTDHIRGMLYDALQNQYRLDTCTTPWEAAYWTKSDLNQVVIYARDVDRLYHIIHTDENDDPYEIGEFFEMVARMQYMGLPLYVHLCASCDNSYYFDCEGQGHVLVSREVNHFMRCILETHAHVIYESLIQEAKQMPVCPRSRRRSRRQRRHRQKNK